jgi:response regulator NasT
MNKETPPITLRIVVVNPVVNPGDLDDASIAAQVRRGTALRIGLLESGYDIVASLPADMYLPERIAQLQPDLIIIDADSDARDVLEHIVIATRDERRPIVLFTEDDTTSSMDAAMAAGVSAYIVAGCRPSASNRY